MEGRGRGARSEVATKIVAGDFDLRSGKSVLKSPYNPTTRTLTSARPRHIALAPDRPTHLTLSRLHRPGAQLEYENAASLVRLVRLVCYKFRRGAH